MADMNLLTTVPGDTSTADGGTHGISFKAGANMSVKTLRFKPKDWTTWTVSLWRNSDGTKIATKQYTGGAGAWVDLTLDTPVTLTSGQSYTISVLAIGGTRLRQSTSTFGSSFFTSDVSELALMHNTDLSEAFPNSPTGALWFQLDFVYEYGAAPPAGRGRRIAQFI